MDESGRGEPGQEGIVLYLNGTSSSGKTALARELHRVLPGSWLIIEGDTFFRDLSHPEPWTVQPIVSGIHALAATVARGGVGVIIDGLLTTRTWLKDAVEQLTERRAFLVAVRCPLDELERRERTRGDRRLGSARTQLDFAHAHGVDDFEIDTSQGDPATCAARVAAWLDGAPAPVAFGRLRDSAYLCEEDAYGWVLTRGATGPAVRRLQEDLRMLGHDPGPADGVFGERTEEALRSFQAARGLRPDGAMGWPHTVRAMLDAMGQRRAGDQ
jgi:chloramphenicol 3-O phosphotransferase